MKAKNREPFSDPHGRANGHRAPRPDPWLAVTQVWGSVRKRWPEFERHLKTYGTAQLDRSRLYVRRAVTKVLLAVAAGILAITMVIAAATLVVLGISGSLGALFGSVWLGQLATGALFLGGGAIAFAVVRARRRRRRFHALVRKYEGLARPSDAPMPARELEPQGPEL